MTWAEHILGAPLPPCVLLPRRFPLWPLVFQPIIGVLMLGALVSGGVSWLQGQQQGRGS